MSASVTPKSKFPIKAVYGGLVGNGRSSLSGRSATEELRREYSLSNERKGTDNVVHGDLCPERH